MTEVRLPVPYFSQNDNDDWDGVAGNVQCAATSNAMLLNFLRPGALLSERSEPETLYKERFNSLGYSADDRGNHDAHTAALTSFGLISHWITQGTDAIIKAMLDRKMPVVAGLCYKSAGHIVLIVGYDSNGYLIHDPYGVRAGAEDWYETINEGKGGGLGAFEQYSYPLLEKLLFSDDEKRVGAWIRTL